jgi:glucose-6-phosphate isomerase
MKTKHKIKGLQLNRFQENQTIQKQIQWGVETTRSFESSSFQDENKITLDITYVFDAPGNDAITKEDIQALIPKTIEAHQMLKKGEGDIRDGDTIMTGWQDLPVEIDETHLEKIRSACRALSNEIDAFVSLGIGGSYLGFEATLRALTHQYFNQLTREQRGGAPEIYFLGQNMDPDYFRDTLEMLEGKRIGVNVISKSGTTTETAIAFRIIQRLIEENFGARAKRLILATTDKTKGALRRLATEKGYQTFTIPDNIGGRFSVLTDVGLVGLAMANIDIGEFVAGFRHMRHITMTDAFWKNPALVHAAVRHAAWLKGKKIEVVATNSTALYYIARWMEQLFPESEGHEGRGMWVSPTLYSEKLHANGQMVQQGERNIFETFLFLLEHDNHIEIPRDETNLDGLNFLPDTGLDMNHVNAKVIEGPAYAHYRGSVPNMTIRIPRRNAFNLGQIYYMMEKSVALSGYLMAHNPFIQPGVEDYKKAMFALIGKPGFEKEAKTISENIQKLQRVIIHAG